MADVFSKAIRSAIMSRIRSSGNELTELTLARIFREQKISGWRRGVEIRVAKAGEVMTIKPDFTFRKRKLALFVDGEFWHGHPTRASMPKSNRDFWVKKINRNKARDRLQNRLLRKHGWTVFRIWQRDIRSLRWLKKLLNKISSPPFHGK